MDPLPSKSPAHRGFVSSFSMHPLPIQFSRSLAPEAPAEKKREQDREAPNRQNSTMLCIPRLGSMRRPPSLTHTVTSNGSVATKWTRLTLTTPGSQDGRQMREFGVATGLDPCSRVPHVSAVGVGDPPDIIMGRGEVHSKDCFFCLSWLLIPFVFCLSVDDIATALEL